MPYFIKSTGLITNPNNRTIGSSVTKDLNLKTSTATYNGYLFPANTYYFNDWGNDCFDSFGHFTLERASDGSKVPIPLPNANTPDGVLNKYYFEAFGNTYSVIYGYPVQGIFKIQIELLHGTPTLVNLYVGGNFGADGQDALSFLYSDFNGNISNTNYRIKYLKHSDNSGNDPSVFIYLLPYDDDLFNSDTFAYNINLDNFYIYRGFKNGINFYMSKTNDVVNWIRDDISEVLNLTTYGFSSDLWSKTKWGSRVIPREFASVINTLNDNVIKNIYNSLSEDSNSVVDSIILKSTLSNSDSTSLSDNVTSFYISKILTDNISLSDSLVSYLSAILDSDSISLSDLSISKLTKTNDDSITLSDSIISKLSALLTDLLSLDDSITPKLYVLLQDVVSLIDDIKYYAQILKDDSISINDDITKNILSSFSDLLALEYIVGGSIVTDILSSNPTKVITDSLSLIDDLTKVIKSFQNDNLVLSDLIYSYIKLGDFSETLSLIDDVIKYVYMGSFSEAIALLEDYFTNPKVNTSDVVNLSDTIANYIKLNDVSDSITLSETIVNYVKKYSLDETLSLLDGIQKMFSKQGLIDTASITEVISLYPKLGDIQDNILVIDEDNIIKNIKTNYDEVLTLTENLYKLLSKYDLSDSILLLETINNYINKYGLEETLNITEYLTNYINKNGVDETLTLSENIVNLVNKNIDLTLTLSDLVNSKANSLKTESTTIDDIIGINVSKILNDTIILSDEVLRKLIFMRPLPPQFGVGEFENTQFDGEGLGISDELTDISIKLGYFATDTLDVVDSLIKYIQKSLADSVSLSEDLNKNILSSQAEVTLLSDDTNFNISILKTETLTLLDNIIKNIKNALNNENLDLTDDITKNTILNIALSISVIDVINSYMYLLENDNLNLDDLIEKKVSLGNFVDNLNLSDSIMSKVMLSIQETLNLVDDYIKSIALYKTEVLDLIDDITSKYIYVNKDDLLSVFDSIANKIILGNFDEAISLLDITLKNIYLGTFSETLILADNYINNIYYNELDTLTLADELTSKYTYLNKSDLINLLDEIFLYVKKENFNEALDTLDNLLKQISLGVLTDNTTLSDNISNNIKPVLADTTALAEDIVKSISVNISDLFNLSDALNYKISLLQQEVLNVNDDVVKSITTVLSDLIAINDALMRNLNETLPQRGFGYSIFNFSTFGDTEEDSDIISLVDDVQIKMLFSQLINDLNSLIDNININTGKDNGNENLGITETIGMHVAKLLNDDITVSDLLIFNIFLNLNDSINVLDDIIKNITFMYSDDIPLAENINLYVGKLITEVINVSDDIIKMSKLLYDETINVDDLLTRLATLQKSETISLVENFALNTKKDLDTDLINVSDLLNLLTSKLIEDSISLYTIVGLGEIVPNDLITNINVNKKVSDILDLDDILNTSATFRSNLSDTITLLELLFNNVGKMTDEVLDMLDVVGIKTTKSLTELISTLDDISNINVFKLLQDTVNITENIITNFCKILELELLSLDDNIQKNIYTSALDDLNTMLDTFNILFNKISNDIISVVDYYNFYMNVAKAEALVLSETFGTGVKKPLDSDLVGVIDYAKLKAKLLKTSDLTLGDDIIEVKKVVILNQVFIEGISVPVIGLSIKDSISDRVSTCEFSIPDPSPTILNLCKPRAEIKVLLADGDGRTYAFGGRINDVKLSSNTSVTNLLQVTAFDYTDFANDVRVAEIYTEQDGTVTDIIEKMWRKYSPFSNLNYDIVYSTYKIPSMMFRYDTLFSATDKLAELIGYSWYIDFDGNSITLKLFPSHSKNTDYIISPQNYNLISKSANFSYSKNIYNKVYLFGGSILSDNVIYEFIANGTDDMYLIPHLAYPPFNLGETDYKNIKVLVDGVEKTVDFDYPNWLPNIDVYHNFEGKYIRFKNKPNKGSNIKVIYRYFTPLTLVMDNAESINKYGLSEIVLTNDKITNYEGAVEYIKNYLKDNSEPKISGGLETTEMGIRAGDIIRVTIPKMNIDGEFEVVEVEKRVERTFIRTFLQLNNVETPEEVIARRLREFNERIQDLQLSKFDNSFIQKVNSISEKLKYRETLSITGEIYYNNNENINLSDGFYGKINNTIYKTAEFVSLTTSDSVIKTLKPKYSDNITSITETLLVVTNGNINNTFGNAKFGLQSFKSGVFINVS